MSPLDAAMHVAHDYPGGAAALALRMGKGTSTFSHEVDPEYATAKLGLDTAVRMSILARDPRVLFAFADALGFRCVPVRPLEEIGDEDLALAIAQFDKEVGEALESVSKALADGRVTENEVQYFEEQVADISPRAMVLAAALRRVAEKQAQAAVRPCLR